MQAIDSILSVAAEFEAIVFDQWGVLHNGSAPYPDALETIAKLAATGVPLAVLSNSGKRADLNAARITGMGFAADSFNHVMTSGEALWRDFEAGLFPHIKSLIPITASPKDAAIWRGTFGVSFCTDIEKADAVLLMGLPDGSDHSETKILLETARQRNLPLICSNPDRASPRAGHVVISPGALAHDYRDAGGKVTFYGKPYPAIFDSLSRSLDTKKVLMVGDSPEHDIAGAHAAGWSSLFISGGLHVDHQGPLEHLFTGKSLPTFTLETLR